jgi:subtilisin family serine protease
LKPTRRLLVGLVVVVAIAAGTSAASGGDSRSRIVTLRAGSPAEHAKRTGVRPTFIYGSALRGYAAAMSDATVRKLRRDPAVVSVEDDGSYALPPTSSAPAIAQPPQSTTPAVARVGADVSPTAAIDGVDERVDVDVAIIDTGIQKDHPDLNVVGGFNCTGRNRRAWGDVLGHGTHVAGLVGAIDNAIGVVGVAPGARLWSARVFGNRPTTDSVVLCAIDWVTRHADIIEVANMSLGRFVPNDVGACGSSSTRLSAVHRGICRSVAAGVTYVVSGGNASSNARRFAPAAFPEVITVSAMTDTDGVAGGLGPASTCGWNVDDDRFAPFSNWGPVIDISAPGVCVLSTFRDSGYETFSGTSMSSPLVAGAAALYVATNPGSAPADVRLALLGLAEAGPIEGDPDAFPEGVLDVSTL